MSLACLGIGLKRAFLPAFDFSEDAKPECVCYLRGRRVSLLTAQEILDEEQLQICERTGQL